MPDFLLVWIALGLLVLASFPFARGDALFGATLPFWLVVAPALDLLWLARRNLVADPRRRPHAGNGFSAMRKGRMRRTPMALRAWGTVGIHRRARMNP